MQGIFKVHPGAVYLLQGVQYVVESFDHESTTARVRPSGVKYFTKPRDGTNVQITTTRASLGKAGARCVAKFGDLHVSALRRAAGVCGVVVGVPSHLCALWTEPGATDCHDCVRVSQGVAGFAAQV